MPDEVVVHQVVHQVVKDDYPTADDFDHERVVLALVEVPFYGKKHHGEQVAASLQREVQLQFARAKVKHWSQMEVG